MRPLLRTSLLALVAGLLARLAVPPLADVLAGGVAGEPFDVLLQAVLAAALLTCLTWWTVGAVLTTLADLLVRVRPASAAARLCTAAAERVTPTLVRRLVTAGLGVAVSGGALAGTATADPGEHRPTEASVASALTGLPLPDRTVGAAPALAAEQRATDAHPTVRVRRGDSLWSISADRLPAGTTTARVAGATRALYAANADRIGTDPDLIQPGTTLHLPPSLHERPTPRTAAPDREDRP